MGAEVSREKGRAKTKRRSKRNMDSIVPDYIPSMIPLGDMEVPTVTTVYTVMDYLGHDKAMPKDPEYVDKIDVVPIPTEKNFSGTPDEISAFLNELADSPEGGPTSYTLTSIQIEAIGYFLVQLRMKYFPGMPARVVLFPKDTNQRTFGVFTTEKILPK